MSDFGAAFAPGRDTLNTVTSMNPADGGSALAVGGRGTSKRGAGISQTTITLSGYLTRVDLAKALAASELSLQQGRQRLLIDARRMLDYASEARSYFVDWNRRNKSRIEGVAVVTDKALWHMVVSAMALASRQKLRAFWDVPSANSWLQTLGPTR